MTVRDRILTCIALDRESYADCRKEALKLWVVLARCFNSISQALAQQIKAYDLTFPQFGVLEALAHLGPMKMCDIGSKLLMSGGNVTGVVDRLEEKGLVRRVVEADDRRTFVIHLTETGGKLIGKIFPQQAAEIEKITNVLSPQEKRMLTTLLKKLGKSI
jgi:MarR family 2-MHQ and catechol resistance regulon transcriptional repressor